MRARRVCETQEFRRVAEAATNDKTSRPDFRSLAAFWPYARAQKRRIALALIALVIASLATLALPLACLLYTSRCV